MLEKKAFVNSYWDNCFFIINFNSQELIRHIHCFKYIFCHPNTTMEFCWFYVFLSYGLYLGFYSLCVLYIYYSKNAFILIMTCCRNSISIQLFAFLWSLLSTKNEYIFAFNPTNSPIATVFWIIIVF